MSGSVRLSEFRSEVEQGWRCADATLTVLALIDIAEAAKVCVTDDAADLDTVRADIATLRRALARVDFGERP